MKSRKQTKIVILASLVIAALAALSACTLGASRETTENPQYQNEADYNLQNQTTQNQPASHTTPSMQLSYPTNPLTHEDFVAVHIANVASSIGTPHITIVESRVDRFEKLAEISDILPQPIELWTLEFALRAEYEPFVRWGSFEAGAGGWISNATSFNEAYTTLAFYYENGELRLLDAIPWHIIDGRGTDMDIYILEQRLRLHLESIGMIMPVSFPGNHYFAYVFNDHTGEGYGHHMRLLLSQPVRQGDGGIWFVERVHHLHEVETFPVSVLNWLETPLIRADFLQMQHMADDGTDNLDRTSPTNVALDHLDTFTHVGPHVVLIELVEVPDSFANPFDMPRRYGPTPVEGNNSHMFRGNPTTFTPDWLEWNDVAHIYLDLRESTLERLGGLALNEAYHFQTDEGLYALITGWRPHVSYEEFRSLYPNVDLPAEVGDFTLQSIVFDNNFMDWIMVYSNPIPPGVFLNNNFGDRLPVGQVFEHGAPLRSFLAIYANGDGTHIGMGVFNPGWGGLDGIMTPVHTRIDMDTCGAIYFAGANDRYIIAAYQDPVSLQVVEFVFLDAHGLPTSYVGYVWGWYHGLVPSTQQSFADVVCQFEPRRLLAEFGWGF